MGIFFPLQTDGRNSWFYDMLLPTKVVYLADFIKQMVESMWLLNLSCFIPALQALIRIMERSLLNVCLFFKRFLIKIVYFSELWFGLHSLGSFVFELLSKACAVVLLIKLVSWCINAESAITVLFLFHSGWSRFLLMCKRLKIPKQKD